MADQRFHNLNLAAASLVCATLLFNAAPLMADDSAAGSAWNYSASMYIWGSSINITTPPGPKIEVPFHQILSDLKMVFMGDFTASNDKWSIMTDLIYLDMKQRNIHEPDYPIGEILVFSSSVQQKNWIVSPTVGYALHDSDKSRVEVFGGLRYLWIKLGVQIDVQGNPVFDRTGSGSSWDGIVGLRTKVNLNKKWFMPMSIDVGGGDSDGTWQGIAGIGYDWGRFDTSLTYRYLQWKFDDVPTMTKLVVKGPLLNLNYKF